MDLLTACTNNDLKQIAELIAAGVDLNASTSGGWTPVHDACHSNNVKALELLIAAGADLNMKSLGGRTPTYVACIDRNVEALELLITAGADHNASVVYGWTPVYCACMQHNDRALVLLLAAGVDFSERVDSIELAIIRRTQKPHLKLLQLDNIYLLSGPVDWISGDLGLPTAVMREVMTWL